MKEYPIHERQIIYFIKDSELENLQHYDQGRDLLLKKEIQVIPLSQAEEFLQNFDIIDGHYPTEQTMLVISPNNPRKYAEVENSTSQFALHKLTMIIRLCQLLGSKNVIIEDIYEERDLSNMNTNTEGSYTRISASVATDSKKENELSKYIGYTANYIGGEGNYEMAKLFLKKNHLGGDIFLSNLVEMCDPEFQTNRVASLKKQIKLSTKSTKTFKLLADLKIPVGGGKFEMNRQNISQKDYILNISIEF